MQDTLIKQLILPFWSICSFQKGPQDLPASLVLMIMLLLGGAVLDVIYLSLSITEVDFGSLLLMLLANNLSMLSITIVLLVITGYKNRIVQTISALQGAGIILTLCALPIILVIRLADAPASPLSMFITAIILWGMAVTAHILRHALSVSLLLGWFLAFGYYMVGFELARYFLPTS